MHGMSSHRSSLRVKATKDYAAVYSDEITFEKGDIFELIQKHSDDWWTGSIHNRVGVFPATHVKVLGPDGQTGITGISQVLARKWREKTRRKESDSESPPRPPPRSRRPVPSPPKLRFRPPPPPPPRDYQRIQSAPASSRLDDVYIPISRVQEDTFSRSRDEDIYIPISRAQASSTVSHPRDSSPITHDQEDEVYAPISRARESSARESRSHHSREDLEDGDDDVPEDGIVQGAAALTVTKSDDCDETDDDDDEEENDDTHREETGNNSLEMLLTQIDSLNDKIKKEQDSLERECTALDGRHAREVAEMKEKHRSEKNKIETSGKIIIRDLKKLLERLTTQVEKAGRWSREVEREDTSLSQELECPVCLVEMRPPTRIWQCGSGHTLCEDCKNRKEVTRCPTCRRGFTGRAIAMERLISTVFSQR